MSNSLFNRMKAWLLKGPETNTAERYSEAEIAVAALLVEAASMDGQFDAQERATILKLLAARFSLGPDECATLLAQAETRQGKDDAVFKFALAARNAFNEEEREGLMEMLWTTILSDGTVHDFEGSLMRRIAGLLHVPDKAAGEARKRAAVKLAGGPQGQGDEA